MNSARAAVVVLGLVVVVLTRVVVMGAGVVEGVVAMEDVIWAIGEENGLIAASNSWLRG